MLFDNRNFPVAGYLAEQYRANANLLLHPVVKTRVKRAIINSFAVSEILHNNAHNAGI